MIILHLAGETYNKPETLSMLSAKTNYIYLLLEMRDKNNSHLGQLRQTFCCDVECNLIWRLVAGGSAPKNPEIQLPQDRAPRSHQMSACRLLHQLGYADKAIINWALFLSFFLPPLLDHMPDNYCNAVRIPVRSHLLRNARHSMHCSLQTCMAIPT